MRLAVFPMLAILAMAPESAEPAGDVRDPGTLIVRWSIAGHHTYGDCERLAAVETRIRVLDRRGLQVREDRRPCSAFGAALALAQGSYRFRASLRDARGGVVLAPREADASVQAEKQTVVSIDFNPNDR